MFKRFTQRHNNRKKRFNAKKDRSNNISMSLSKFAQANQGALSKSECLFLYNDGQFKNNKIYLDAKRLQI